VNRDGSTVIEEGNRQGFFLWWERARDLQRLIDHLLEDEAFGSRIDSSRTGAAGFSLGGYTVLECAGARAALGQLERYCIDRESDPRWELPPEACFSMEDRERLIENAPRLHASMAEQGASCRDARVRSVVAIAPAAGMALTPESL
jgi:predicted dienelactone hydrolase